MTSDEKQRVETVVRQALSTDAGRRKLAEVMTRPLRQCRLCPHGRAPRTCEEPECVVAGIMES